MMKMLMVVLMAIAAGSTAAAQDDPPPPPEVQQAAEAYGECLQDGLETADARGPARTAARAIVQACAMQATRVTEAHRAWVQSSSLNERERAEAVAANRRSMEGVEAQLVREIEESRAD